MTPSQLYGKADCDGQFLYIPNQSEAVVANYSQYVDFECVSIVPHDSSMRFLINTESIAIYIFTDGRVLIGYYLSPIPYGISDSPATSLQNIS